MKVAILFSTLLLIGVCWALPAEGNQAPPTKVADKVSYKIDSKANFSNKTIKSVARSLSHPSKSLNVNYKEAHDDSMQHLLITSYEKCIENRKNNFCYPGNVIVVCVESYSRAEIESAVKFALMMNRKA
jgi:hypothetical protein